MDHMLNARPDKWAPEKKYRVAPLKWEDSPELAETHAECWIARNSFGCFVYGRDLDGLFYFQTPGPCADRPTLEAARDAAQAYYASLVRRHLEEIT